MSATSQMPVMRSLKADADGAAIAAIISAFFIPPLGIIMGHVSRGQAKRHGMKPSAVATWGCVLGYVFTAIAVIIIIAAAATTPSASTPQFSPQPQTHTSAPARTSAERIQAWESAGGTDEMNAVLSDLSQTKADADSQDVTSLMMDGQQLSDDAKTAASDPPPVAGDHYTKAMSYLAKAGNFLAQGTLSDIESASPLMIKATHELTLATEELKSVTS